MKGILWEFAEWPAQAALLLDFGRDYDLDFCGFPVDGDSLLGFLVKLEFHLRGGIVLEVLELGGFAVDSYFRGRGIQHVLDRLIPLARSGRNALGSGYNLVVCRLRDQDELDRIGDGEYAVNA